MRSFCLTLLLFLTLGGHPEGYACDIPVFQYALDYWEPDVFEVLIYHRGGIAATGLEALRKFEDSAANHSFFNYGLETLDVDQANPKEADAEIAAGLDPGEAVVVVHSPSLLHRPKALWQGPLSEETYSKIADSPLRQRIGEKLLSGTTAVWVLLESGDQDKDQVAFETLRKELGQAEGPLEFLSLTGATSEVQLTYDIERLSRDTSEESFLVEMLLSTEPDLRDSEFEGLPMAFPVFGRGRVLYALIGDGINPNTIREACEFLTGACSCEIKDLNPGADLLLAMDWKSAVEERVKEMEEEIVLSEKAPSQGIESPAAIVAEPVVKNLTLVVAILMGIVAAGALAVFWRSQNS